MRLAIVLALMVGSVVAVADAPQRVVRPSGMLVLVIDRSGSMRGERLEAAKVAIKAAHLALHPDDRISVIAFNEQALVVVRPVKASNKESIHREVDRLEASGGTDLLPALKEAADGLHLIKADRKHVIVMADGEFRFDGIADVVKAMRKDNVTVTSVGLGDANRDQLSQIADHGGGRMYLVTQVKSLAPVFVKDIAEAKLTTP